MEGLRGSGLELYLHRTRRTCMATSDFELMPRYDYGRKAHHPLQGCAVAHSSYSQSVRWLSPRCDGSPTLPIDHTAGHKPIILFAPGKVTEASSSPSVKQNLFQLETIPHRKSDLRAILGALLRIKIERWGVLVLIFSVSQNIGGASFDSVTITSTRSRDHTFEKL